MAKATPKVVREFFRIGDKLPSMTELKELKDADGGKHYDHIAEGIGNGTFTY